MKATRIAAVAGLAALVAAAATPASACNQRGEFCSYPGWASNAFAHPRDRINPEISTMTPRPSTASVRGYARKRNR